MMPREERAKSKRTVSRSKRPVSNVRRYWWLAPVLVLVAFVLWLATGPEWSRPRTGKTTDLTLPPGYVTSFATVVEEYHRFYGKPLQDKELSGRFESGTRYMTQHDYVQAAQVLEEVARTAAVPAVFNDLGLVYLAQNDRGKAINAFREALSRDIDYQQVRRNLDRMKEIGFENATPLTHEIEANNALLMANIIAPSKPVEGEIMAAVNDIDCFKVVTPPAPRDTLIIQVTPRGGMLEPMLKVYDSERRMLQWVKGKDAPGKPVSVTLAPPPNSTLFLEVAGFADSAGLYTVKVTPQKSFDSYEPNDEVFNARPIPFDTAIAANIMDRADTDYYSFETAGAGTVKVTIQNRSSLLIPALTTFTPDMRSSGFGPNARGPGANLEHILTVEANKRYFIQVWSQSETAGDYILTIHQSLAQ
jgi:hypothetical protein